MSFDSKCLDTAQYFLGTVRECEDEESLANAIQAAVETWFLHREFSSPDRLSKLEKLVDSHREHVS